MHERYAGKVRVNDLVHLGIGPNLEKVWELVLNLDQRPSCGDLQDERCIAKQRAVADRRYERVLGALDHLQPNRAAA